jgi:DNA-binding beta-propeller fold protein YncE
MKSTSIYVSDTSAGTITKLKQDGSSAVVAMGLNGPAGIILDSWGRLLYVACSGGGTIEKFDLSGNHAPFASNLSQPMGLALDRDGNVFVAGATGGTIMKFDSGGHGSTFAQGLSITNPYLRFDASGNLYASNTRTVEQFAPNGARTTVLTVLNFVYDIAFDCCGQRYVSLQNAGAISGLPGNGLIAGDNPQSFSPSGLGYDRGNGHLYAAFGQTLRKYHPDGIGRVFASGFAQAQYIAVSACEAAPFNSPHLRNPLAPTGFSAGS